ncbi:MAG: oligoribonuclease [Candidatus Saccharibacteria bacterium]|nr:oligoribonuclease [Candidatus Saccharibacteria bacterium]
MAQDNTTRAGDAAWGSPIDHHRSRAKKKLVFSSEATPGGYMLDENGGKAAAGPARAMLLWMDLEMTGLDPVKDRILEVAAIATDLGLNKVATYTAVVKVDEQLMKDRMVGPFWEKNSKSRDALIQQNQSGKPIQVVEQELLDFIDQHCAKELYLAGNSIHQDRKFIEREMPTLNQRLHYRMLDVSAWKIYFENALHQKFTKPENHRALDDINGSIEELKWYLTFLK